MDSVVSNEQQSAVNAYIKEINKRKPSAYSYEKSSLHMLTITRKYLMESQIDCRTYEKVIKEVKQILPLNHPFRFLVYWSSAKSILHGKDQPSENKLPFEEYKCRFKLASRWTDFCVEDLVKVSPPDAFSLLELMATYAFQIDFNLIEDYRYKYRWIGMLFNSPRLNSAHWVERSTQMYVRMLISEGRIDEANRRIGDLPLKIHNITTNWPMGIIAENVPVPLAENALHLIMLLASRLHDNVVTKDIEDFMEIRNLTCTDKPISRTARFHMN